MPFDSTLAVNCLLVIEVNEEFVGGDEPPVGEPVSGELAVLEPVGDRGGVGTQVVRCVLDGELRCVGEELPAQRGAGVAHEVSLYSRVIGSTRVCVRSDSGVPQGERDGVNP